MPKLFCLVQMQGGNPNVDATVTPWAGGYAHHETIGNWGAYIFSGTGPQLVALNALPQVVGIVAVTEAGDVRWPELDGAIAAAVRTKLNTWLTARDYPNIPSGWTYRQVVNAVYQRLNDKFDLSGFDVTE